MADEQQGEEHLKERWRKLTGSDTRSEGARDTPVTRAALAAKSLKITVGALALVLLLACGIWYDTKARMAGLVQEIGGLKKTIEGLQAELADLTRDYERVKRENKALRTECDATRADVAQLEQHVDALKARKEKAEAKPRSALPAKGPLPEAPGRAVPPAGQTGVSSGAPSRQGPAATLETSDRRDARTYRIR